MPNMKTLSLTVQKLKRRLKLTTDRQTNKQTDRQTNREDKNNMPPIIRSGGIKSFCSMIMHNLVLCSLQQVRINIVNSSGEIKL